MPMNTRIFLGALLVAAVLLFGCAGAPDSGGGRARVHTVRPGETLSEIAMAYYGTYKKFGTLEALKRANGIRDAQDIRVGQRLRIPPVRVDGRWMPEGTAPAPRRSAPEETPSARKAPAGSPRARGVEALGEERYDEAVANLGRAHRENPDDPDVRQDLATARYQQAVRHFETKDFVAARDGFQRVLELRPDCQECRAYLGEIDDRAEALLDTGKKRYESGRYADAADILEGVVRLAPGREEAVEYRFRAYFDEALSRFSTFQETGRASERAAARTALSAARKKKAGCPACRAYEETVKQRLYNEGIRNFTEEGSEQLEKAVRVWERVRFADPGYRDVAGNIRQARSLLEKLRDI